MATDRIAEIRAREAADSELLSRAPESSDDWDDATWEAWGRVADRAHAVRPTVSQLQDRIAELEAAKSEFLFPWAYKLDAKSLDNFVGDLIRAAESPLLFVVDEIHRTVAAWRNLVSAQPWAVDPAPKPTETAGGEPPVEDDKAALRSRIAELESVLAERDEQIAYLIAAEPTMDDDQPAAPR